MRQGKLKVVAGRTGTGKTSKVMEILSQEKSCFVYDFQKHYHELKWFDETGHIHQEEGLTLVNNINEFDKEARGGNLKLRVPPSFGIYHYLAVANVMEGFTMAIEEATGLFPNGRIPNEMVEMILSKRHTGNDWILVFHNMHRVPIQLYEFIDELYLFKTNDVERNIKAKFPVLLENGIYSEIKNHLNPYYHRKLFVNDFL